MSSDLLCANQQQFSFKVVSGCNPAGCPVDVGNAEPPETRQGHYQTCIAGALCRASRGVSVLMSSMSSGYSRESERVDEGRRILKHSCAEPHSTPAEEVMRERSIRDAVEYFKG